MALTDVKIRQAKADEKPRKLADANGLYIEVKPNGSKLWRYRKVRNLSVWVQSEVQEWIERVKDDDSALDDDVT